MSQNSTKNGTFCSVCNVAEHSARGFLEQREGKQSKGESRAERRRANLNRREAIADAWCVVPPENRRSSAGSPGASPQSFPPSFGGENGLPLPGGGTTYP